MLRVYTERLSMMPTRPVAPLIRLLTRLSFILLLALSAVSIVRAEAPAQPQLAYVVSDLRIPFWDILQRGVVQRAEALGYRVHVYSADNDARQELMNMARALDEGVAGIVLSPTNSSAAVTLLKQAERAKVPVVIADIGTEGGQHVSYIASDNEQGAYDLGRILVNALFDKGWQEGTVGVVAIPQKRANGRARTEGFIRALDEAGIRVSGLLQQADFSYVETYNHARALINSAPELRALWLQGSDRYQGALDAIRDLGREGEILLVCFDAEPEFLDMIPAGTLTGAAMQQPFLMGEEAVESLHAHLKGVPVAPVQQLPILAVSSNNIAALRPLILRNVLGQR